MIDLFFKNRGTVSVSNEFRELVNKTIPVFKTDSIKYALSRLKRSGNGKPLLLVFERSNKDAWVIVPLEEH